MGKPTHPKKGFFLELVDIQKTDSKNRGFFFRSAWAKQV